MIKLKVATMMLILSAAAVTAAGSPGAQATGSFNPQVDVSLSNPNPSANSNVSVTTFLATGNAVLGNWALNIPIGWDVARDTQVPYGDAVAEVTMTVDVDCNGTLDDYGPFLLSNQPADPTAVANWEGQINSWWPLSVSVDGSSSQGFDISADMTNVTEYHTLCAPETFIISFYGRSTGNNIVLTNPSNTGNYTWLAAQVSLGAEFTAQTADIVCVCATPDSDLDGVVDVAEASCGSNASNPNSRPERIDSAYTGADDDADTLVDEALPAGAENYDCDGDGYSGVVENHVYAPSVRGDQDACGANASPATSPPSPIGWPADLKGGSLSADLVDLQDLASFISPVRRLNTNPGDPGYDVRWDVLPGSTIGAAINIQDLSNVSLLQPPMLGGARAFDGLLCPWPSVDADHDGVIDEAQCGGDPLAGGRRPERTDGPFAGIDDDGDTLVDENLPAGASVYDCDGDGYRGTAEDHVFAPIVRKDQDGCGIDAWPADFASGGVSLNKVSLSDLTSFIAPVKRLNTSPGDAGYNVRWDIVPGSSAGKKINLIDMTSLTTVVPPMLGVRAFGGPACPWPP